MRFLEKLLDGAEVTWVPIAELFHLKNGYTPSKSKKEFWEDGKIPWFRMDDIRQNGQILDSSLQKITESAVKRGKLFPENSIIIATSATIGEHALITVPHLANQRFTNLSVKEKYAEKLNIKYLYYYGFLLADWCKKNTTVSSFASVDMAGFRKFRIPIPCPDNPAKSLAIQAEIVRILDAFTAMTTELTTELSARKKQYNYYRERLLGFTGLSTEPPHPLRVHPTTPSGFACHPSKAGEWDGNKREAGEKLPFLEKLLDGAKVAWVPIAELFHLKNGYTPSKSKKEFWEDGKIPWFRMDDIRQNGQILDSSLQKITESAVKRGKLFPENSIIIATSATIGEHALITVPHLANQRFTNLSVKEKYAEKLNIKYLYYYGFLLADWCKKNTTVSSFASVDMAGFRKFRIPIPCPDNPAKSLAIQAEIVRILDTFDTLTHSISEGLPREIALRRKQYEYYRDLLLDFPKNLTTNAHR